MKRNGISQEGLKLIACLTMLIDHIGATLMYSYYLKMSYANGMHMADLWAIYQLMRIIGRIAFPIYCFLLVEGAHYTKNPGKYALRLIVGALLSELPFDLAFSGAPDWKSTSVMITLLLGYLMILAMNRKEGFGKILLVVPFFLLAEILHTDYAGKGIAIIAMLALTKNHPRKKLLRIGGFAVLLWFGASIQLGAVNVPIELFGLFALIPMLCYQGKKRTESKWIQWAFYLFYPVHLTILWLLNGILFP